MNESEPPIPTPGGKPESHEKPKTEVWMVDDMAVLGNIWGIVAEQAGISFRHFEKGEDAVAEIQKRLVAGTDLPQGIFMDGNLDMDQSDFNKGAKVVTMIRSMTVKTPKRIRIVAHSTDKDEVTAMLQAGADIAIEKLSKIADIKSAIKQIAEQHEKTP